MYKKLFICIFLIFGSVNAFSQIKEKLVITSQGNQEKFILMSESETSRSDIIMAITDSLVNAGYLSPEFNEIRTDSIHVMIIEKGRRFRWAKLEFNFEGDLTVDRILAELSKSEGEIISVKEFKNLNDRILSYCESNGYPFSVSYLDSIVFLAEDSVSARMNVRLNKKFYFDTIKIVSKLDLSRKYLENFLDIRKGDMFDRSKVNSIAKLIENIPFVKLKEPPGLFFFGDKVSVNLDLIPQQVNRFDFLLGFQRGQNTEIKKYKLTGDILVELINKLGKGERIFFNYKNLSKGTQELKLQANYPYILEMPFGIDTRFEIFLNESEYRDVNFDLGLLYLLRKNNNVKLYWSTKSSRVLSIDSLRIISALKLPDKLDISNNNLGTGLDYSTLDYNFNPTKGYLIRLDGNAGVRKIIRNQQILGLKNEQIDFITAYDSLKNNSYGFNATVAVDHYFRISQNFVVKLGNSTGVKYVQEKIYQNELFRLGGLRLLRGFNENSVLADIYNVSTFEFRLLISRNSNMYIFSDLAFVRDPFSKQKKWDRPYGVGAGINFDTRGGLLQLAAAIGSQYGNPLNFKNPNVHIGYTSLFR